MSKSNRGQTAYDESGQQVESAPGVPGERKPKNSRTWAIQGLRQDGQGYDVIAEGMTRGQSVKMVQQSLPLLRRLYTKIRLVKTVIGEEVDL